MGDFYAYSITQTEGADCYIIGGILPVVAALLRRNVWLPWANGELYPNLYATLVGPPGNMKSTSIELPEILARGIFSEIGGVPYLLTQAYSPESLFDAYYKHPHRLLICDDANATITKWKNPQDGDRLSANFLALFDGKRLSENFRRNRQQDDLDSQERWTDLTSTNILFGVTYNACDFSGNTVRSGLDRRFLRYVAEDKAGSLNRPKPDGTTINGLIKQFSLLTYLHGEFSWTLESEKLFDEYKAAIEARCRESDILDDRTRGRLTTACAWVVKIAMIFEACRVCYDVEWMPRDPKIVPTSPPLIIQPGVLELAIKHLESCLEAAKELDQIANRQIIAEDAQILLASVRTKFAGKANHGSIILSKTEITSSFAHHAGRRNATPVAHIYGSLIPYLIRTGTRN